MRIHFKPRIGPHNCTVTDRVLTILLGSYRAEYSPGLIPDIDELRFIGKDIAQDLAVRWAQPPMIAIEEIRHAPKLVTLPW